MDKTELLLPVGNAETFYAAIEGGADAIYLGLRMFNARGRASNFSHIQLWALLEEAKKKNVLVFLTVNTLIKNEEIPDLLDFLHFISQSKLDAIIIQDWGVYHIVKKHFKNITLHASTQMGIHNSLGIKHVENKRFTRAVVARELSFKELKTIKSKTSIEIEVFVHGALCYSFSGMCLFSSFLGGAGANRGLCAQPCRRLYAKPNNSSGYFFSLKDNQQISLIPSLVDIGIDSFKVEGRMKSAEYVNAVVKSYNMVIKDRTKVKDALDILKYDTGREKTEYFLNNDVSGAITKNTSTGLLIGKIVDINSKGFYISSKEELFSGYRLRVKSSRTDSQQIVKLKENFKQEGKVWFISADCKNINVGDSIFIASRGIYKFPNKLPNVKMPKIFLENKVKTKILKTNKEFEAKRRELYVRVDTLQWLKKVHIKSVDYLILNLSKQEWKAIKVDTKYLLENRNRLIFELPKFIPEKDINFYRNLLEGFASNGYRNYMISHVSQKLILPKNAKVFTNENVYVLNDFSAKYLQEEEGIRDFMYPLENDFQNLRFSRNKSGIISLFYHPQLFYSRMPVEVSEFKDDRNNTYQKMIKDGITIIIPTDPVSLLHQKNKLMDVGYKRFLIDFSFIKASSNVFKTILKRFGDSKQIQPSYGFNFKNGLK
jgi:putative protease